MNATKQTAMAAGRATAQVERDKQAAARVLAFRRWNRPGADLRAIPEIPSDSDYEAARRLGKIERRHA